MMKQVPSFLHTHNRTSQSSTTQNTTQTAQTQTSTAKEHNAQPQKNNKQYQTHNQQPKQQTEHNASFPMCVLHTVGKVDDGKAQQRL